MPRPRVKCAKCRARTVGYPSSDGTGRLLCIGCAALEDYQSKPREQPAKGFGQQIEDFGKAWTKNVTMPALGVLVLIVIVAAVCVSLTGGGSDARFASGEVVFVSTVFDGKLIEPYVPFFSLDGCERTAIVGRVDGGVGMPVRILQVREGCDFVMYEVETFGANAGLARGWVSEAYMRE